MAAMALVLLSWVEMLPPECPASSARAQVAWPRVPLGPVATWMDARISGVQALALGLPLPPTRKAVTLLPLPRLEVEPQTAGAGGGVWRNRRVHHGEKTAVPPGSCLLLPWHRRRAGCGSRVWERTLVPASPARPWCKAVPDGNGDDENGDKGSKLCLCPVPLPVIIRRRHRDENSMANQGTSGLMPRF